MNDALSPWADPQLSKTLREIVAKGEGRAAEDIPSQARDLAKGIAAFATSGKGMMLLGVTNEGQVVGLSSVETSDQRDDFSQRVRGIIRTNVRPQPAWRLDWAIHDGKTVAVITVEKGPEPIYYYADRAYVRDGAESRPGSPEDVVRLVKEGRPTGEVTAHDRGIFDAADARLSEKDLLGLMDALQTHHLHNGSQTDRVMSLVQFFRETGNQYLTMALRERSGQLVERLTDLIEFLGFNYFVHPQVQTGGDRQYCLQPELNMNRARDDPRPEEIERYGALTSEQDKVCASVRDAYREYRSEVSRSLLR